MFSDHIILCNYSVQKEKISKVILLNFPNTIKHFEVTYQVIQMRKYVLQYMQFIPLKYFNYRTNLL